MVSGPGQPVRITHPRGHTRQSSSGDHGAMSGAKAPPRPPRSPPSPPLPPPTAPIPAIPAASAAAIAAEEAKEGGSPDNSVHSSTAVGSDKHKQVNFAEKHQSMSEKYTFLREPTPPPLPPPGAFVPGHRFDDEPSLTPAAKPEFYDYKYDHVAPPAPIPGAGTAGTICGIRKRLFWIVLAAALLVIAIAIGVGAGVGVSTSNSSSDDSADAENGYVQTIYNQLKGC